MSFLAPLLASLVCVVALLAGCASLPTLSQQTPEQIASRSAVRRDEFTKMTFVDGQHVLFGDWGQNRYYLGAARQGETGEPVYSLAMFSRRTFREGWAFWNSASDSDGAKLPTEKAGSDVTEGGGTSEAVQVVLSRAYLDQHIETGVKLKIYGRGVEQILEVPGNYIKGFLMKVDQTFK